MSRRYQEEWTKQHQRISELRAENAALRAHYEKEIAHLKRVGRFLHDSVAKAHPEYVNQQVAQTNPYAIA